MSDFPLQYAEKIEPAAGFDVSSWCYYYQKDMKDTLTGDRQCPRLSNFIVKKLNRYKEMSASSHHEFVIAVVEIGPSFNHGIPVTLYYRVERFRATTPGKQSTLDSLTTQEQTEPCSQAVVAAVNDEIKEHHLEEEDEEDPTSSVPSPANPLETSPIATPFSSLAISSLNSIAFSRDGINLKTDADDRVWRVDRLPKLEKGKLILIEYVLPNDMTLSDFVILASTVHEKDRLYSLFKSQCFWFANMIMRVAAGDAGRKCPPGGQAEDKVLIKWSKQGGRWRNITIHKTSRVVVKAITELYEANRNSFYDEIRRTVEEFDDVKKRVQEAERKNEILLQRIAAMEAGGRLYN